VSKTATESDKKKPLFLVSGLEFLVVIALSIAVSALHLYKFKGPNLTLLFDGFGFLTTAAGCMQVFTVENIGQVLSYCFGGFSEDARLKLVETLAPAKEVVRTGPLIPLLLGVAYTLAGKAAVPQFWSVATTAMWITQALMIGFMWLACRIAFNPTVARIAAAIALLYPAFILNGNRIASETQACLAITAATAMFLFYAKIGFRNTDKFVGGLWGGLVLGFLALARPPFLVLPVLLMVAVSFIAWRLKEAIPFKRNWLIGVICGAAALLAPWALCNKILTGKPSITIDRFAVYNLYTGLNTKSQGFDVLPSELVEHPGRFKQALPAVLEEVAESAVDKPEGFLVMAMLKPARLLDSPWNDYQVAAFGVPWLVQRYGHQLLLVLAYVGLFALWSRAVRERSIQSLSTACVFSIVVLYNFIHCLFISMARYTYPVMPVVIVLAAWGIACVRVVPRWWLLTIGVLLAPLPSLLIEMNRDTIMPEVAKSVGNDLFAVLFAVLPTVAFLFFATTVAGVFDAGQHRLKTTYLAASMAITFFVMTVSGYGLRQIAYPLSIGTNEFSITVPQDRSSLRPCWFVVFDPLLEGFSLDAMKGLTISVNGKELTGSVYPLIGTDSSQRASYVYEKAFAHSGQKDLTAFRQWYAIAVPPHLVRVGGNNTVQFKSDGSARIRLASDLFNSFGQGQTVSLLQFSWSKGFTINPPLDMRMFESFEIDPKALEPNANLRPRVALLAVQEVGGAQGYIDPVGEPVVVDLGDQVLRKDGNRMVSLSVPADKLKGVSDGIKGGAGNAVHLKVSGTCAAEKGTSKASIALVTNAGAKETMCPLAPETIPCGTDGKSFSFIDVIPVLPGQDFNLSSLVLVCGQPWWDVLQYGTFKLDAPVQVRQLKLEASVTNLPDLSSDTARFVEYRCQPVVSH